MPRFRHPPSIKDVKIRRDDTVNDGWHEGALYLKRTSGLDDIQTLIEDLARRKMS
ncbi:hypothetical protein KKG90_04430 [Candidatus Bipolaricaulota bacterium]|nr:hypothetical protein [Candidatus Bipolaricaulota bacterium]